MTENTVARKPRTPPARKTRTARRPAAGKAAPAKAAVIKDKPAKSKKSRKEKKAQEKLKVVRDSFTMPQNDYDKLAELKQACQQAGVHVKKSELLRAGLQALSKMSIAQLERAIVQLAPIKTGRPKKS
jgi:hypothetical protein